MTYFVSTKLPNFLGEIESPLHENLYEEFSQTVNCESLGFERLLCFYEQSTPKFAKEFHMKFLLHISEDLKELNLNDHLKFHSISEETISLTLSDQLYLIFKAVIKPRIRKMICPFSEDETSFKAVELQAGLLSEMILELFMNDAEKFLINHLKISYR